MRRDPVHTTRSGTRAVTLGALRVEAYARWHLLNSQKRSDRGNQPERQWTPRFGQAHLQELGEPAVGQTEYPIVRASHRTLSWVGPGEKAFGRVTHCDIPQIWAAT